MNHKKRNLLIAIIGSITIFTVAGILFTKIYQNHLTNEAIIEDCFENFDEVGEVVLEKDGFLSQVTCEKGED
ncbi:hypothetical protein ACQCT6_13275 [Cytobacillus gottheilii]|uniref:hypothetical protein n=1 Tax=Cytobacillus gottheilii TaxID=859144 RepID=UPI000836EC2D|nr:hypothetical protein [Cytobacillus gottheilii]